MAPLDFEILSKLMRFVFTVLGVVIVWRSYAWLRKDRRAANKRLKALPDAGTIGFFTVLQGSSELAEGDVIPVPGEGVLGFVRTCDVVVPVTDVVAQHLDFTFRNGKGLYIYPRRGCPAAVDGVTIDSRADSRRYPMHHGSILQVGEALLQLGVFAGLDVDTADGAWEEPPAEQEPVQQQAPPPLQAPPTPPPAYPPQYPAAQPSALPQMYPAAPQPPSPAPPGYPPQAPYPQASAYPPYPPQATYPPQAPGYPPQLPQMPPYPPQPLTPPQRRPDDEA